MSVQQTQKGAFHLDLVSHSLQFELGVVRSPMWDQCFHFLLCALDPLPAATAIVASSGLEPSGGERWAGKEVNWFCPSHQGLSSVDVAGVLKILKISYPIKASILMRSQAQDCTLPLWNLLRVLTTEKKRCGVGALCCCLPCFPANPPLHSLSVTGSSYSVEAEPDNVWYFLV